MAKKIGKPQAVSSQDYYPNSDARTLAEAKVIMSDPKRLHKAVTAAAQMSIEKDRQAKAMKSVARKGKRK